MHRPKVLRPVHFTKSCRRPTSNAHHLVECRVITAAVGVLPLQLPWTLHRSNSAQYEGVPHAIDAARL